jgi:hypothetical protein
MANALSSRSAACRGSGIGGRLPLHRQAAGRCLAVRVVNDNCLIVNTKGGGHAFLGLHLAKKLLSQGHSVTILNDGDKVGRHEGITLQLAHFQQPDPTTLVCHWGCGPLATDLVLKPWFAGQAVQEGTIQ